MRVLNRGLRGLLLMAGAGCLQASTGCKLFREPRTEALVATHEAAGLKYLEVVPVGPDIDEPLPLVVLVHGLGDRPRASWIGSDSPPARYILPQAPTPHGTGFCWFPYRVNEQNPELDRYVEIAADKLARFIKVVSARHLTSEKPIIAGFSQGGILSLAVALNYPELVSSAQPVAGYLPPALWPEAPDPKANPPIRASHGAEDQIIAVEPTLAMVDILKKRGFDIRLRLFPGEGHHQSPEMKAMMERVIVHTMDHSLR